MGSECSEFEVGDGGHLKIMRMMITVMVNKRVFLKIAFWAGLERM